jgi:fatty acid desaturase
MNTPKSSHLSYHVNKAVTVIALFILFCGFITSFNQVHIFFKICAWIGNVFALHYLMNVVHMASHQRLSRNTKINRFFGMLAATFSGITFDDFRSTHRLHHRFPDSAEDPDQPITLGGSLLTIPFRIWMHDQWFWMRGLWKKQGAWRGYLINRLLQIVIISSLFVTGHMSIWITFWLLPILFVGYANGLFLFYFPHYTADWEGKLKGNFIGTRIQWLINFSRYYHELHHDSTVNNGAYFPLWSYLVTSYTNPITLLSKKYVSPTRRLDKLIITDQTI